MADEHDARPSPGYSSDAPLTSPDDDVFGRWPFSERVARVVRDRVGGGSLVIGLYGTWGEGKTTVLNFVGRALEGDKGVVVVKFNPWRFGDEEVLIRRFFDTLAEAVGKKLKKRWESFGADIQKYATGVSIGGVDAGRVVGAATEVELEEVRARLGRALGEAGLRVVVVVDDIDRLDKQEVHAVFRLVKLSADFEHVTYILAFDPDVVAASLQDRYGTGRERAGYDFLDKIVTVPLQLPPARPQALLKLTVGIVDDALKLSGVEVRDSNSFVNAFHQGLLPAIRTPRMARRYGNAILFALPILAGEVDASDQMLIEGMRVVYPALYDHVRRHPDLYLGKSPYVFDLSNDEKRRAERRSEIDNVIGALVPDHVGAATSLIDSLFPGARGQDSGDTRERRRTQRASSDWHFDRYFSYALAADEVADREFTAMISLAEEGDANAVTNQLRSFANKTSDERLADMLQQVAEHVPPQAVPTLVRGIALAGNLFRDMSPSFLSLPPETLAAAAACKMVGVLPQIESRQELAEAVITTTPSITFAINFQGWVDPAVKGKGEGVVDVAGGRRLVELIADRIAARAQDAPPHISNPEYASRLYGYWMMGRGRDEVCEYLATRLTEHPAEAIAILLSQLPQVQSSSERGSYPGDYSRESYNALALYLDPAVLAEALASVYPSEVLDADHVDMDHVRMGLKGLEGVTVEEAAVRQFMSIHRYVLSQDDSGAASDPEAS